MIKTIKRILLSFSALAMLLVPTLMPVAVSAATDIESGLSCGSDLDPSNIGAETATTCDESAGTAGERIGDIVRLVIQIFSWVVGIVAVIMIIVGGMKYVTSGGDSGKVSSAMNTILYAIVGLVVVALSQFVVRFVLERVLV